MRNSAARFAMSTGPSKASRKPEALHVSLSP
eukprot:CAMPEP_0117531152 /NCGR_PEP_ID=MMETSP0784-20121206/38713_1 /TAXON_ID=39447 /ORGANISM="" /LENGTH=30 /DNA_ID= /DNA_START= /DNA_END= /DNA_ORIENTATION=